MHAQAFEQLHARGPCKHADAAPRQQVLKSVPSGLLTVWHDQVHARLRRQAQHDAHDWASASHSNMPGIT
jgi:hypothetical protein